MGVDRVRRRARRDSGLWLGVGQAGTEMASFGWLLVVLGLVFLAVNLYLRRRGFGMPRRRN